MLNRHSIYSASSYQFKKCNFLIQVINYYLKLLGCSNERRKTSLHYFLPIASAALLGLCSVTSSICYTAIIFFCIKKKVCDKAD